MPIHVNTRNYTKFSRDYWTLLTNKPSTKAQSLSIHVLGTTVHRVKLLGFLGPWESTIQWKKYLKIRDKLKAPIRDHILGFQFCEHGNKYRQGV